MSMTREVTWAKVLPMIGGSIAISATITWALFGLHGQRPHKGAALNEDMKVLQELSGQLGHLSSSNAANMAEMESLRRDLNRVEATLLRMEEKLP